MNTTASDLAVPAGADDVDSAWLTAALGLGPVTSVALTPIGTGNIAATFRLEVAWAGRSGQPESFVIKLASPEPARRRAGMAWRTYEIEAAFFSQLAPGLAARLPHCYWAGFEPERETYAVLLEDLSGLRPGDEITGCTPSEAAAALDELALVHGARWDDPALGELGWFNRWPAGQAGELAAEMTAIPELLDQVGDRLSPQAAAAVRRFAGVAPRYDRKGAGAPRTIAHGDFRNDNLMFGGDRVCILDWQTCHYGSGLADVAYYLGSALPPAARRAHEVDLLRAYHDRLTGQGVDLSWDDCWLGYRRHSLSLLATSIKAMLKIPLDGRGGEVMMLLAERATQHTLDLGAFELLET